MSIRVTELTYIPDSSIVRVLYVEQNSLKTCYLPIDSVSIESRQNVRKVAQEIVDLLMQNVINSSNSLNE